MNDTRRSWLIALGANGEVLAAERGAPTSWRGAKIDEGHEVPASLVRAARAALDAWKAAPAEIAEATVDVPEVGASVKIVVLPAVGLRRALTDVRDLFRHAVLALERQARALDVALTVETDDAVPRALDLDPEKIAWAITAVVGNALRHVKRGTRMMPGGSISIAATRDAAEIVISVSDDGPGMPPELVRALFARAPGAPFATGLALTVVRDVVTAHGGSLEVESSIDPDHHGTTVTMRLPAR